MDEQLDHMSEAQRMAIIAELAASVVHECELACRVVVENGAWAVLRQRVLMSRTGGAA